MGTITNGHFDPDHKLFSDGAGGLGKSPERYFLSPEHIGNIAGHAVIGCGASLAQGGQCGPGAFSAGLGAAAGPKLIGLHDTELVAAQAVIGGTASVVGGGKFENGAVTAAFGYLFNASARCLSGGGCTTEDYQGDAVRDPTRPWLDRAAVAGAGYLFAPFRYISTATRYLYDLLPGPAPSAPTEINLTNTVANNAASRPFVNSPLTVGEIMSNGRGVPDPGGVPGALRYDVPGSFNKSQGTYELVIDPKTNTIYHFMFRGN